MPFVFAAGRVLFILIFIVSGAQKLMDIAGTAALINAKLALPAVVADGLAQAGGMVGMTGSNLLAVIAGAVELIGGLLFAFNIATRPVAVVLLIYTIVTTYVFHNFWTMTGEPRMENMIQAMKNLTAIGGFLVFIVLGSWRPIRSVD